MKKGKEAVDLTQLPTVTETISALILNFETNDKKFKLIESFYKMPEKELKMISREEIIQFAKDQKIYVDPAEGKKPAKGEPAPEHKPITASELAKAARQLIDENSIQFRKNKKDFLDNIENLKKQKEESIAYWAAQAEALAKDPKKKPDKKTPPHPEEIIIPEPKEYDLEYLVVLYNYPLTSEEFTEMEKENIILNNVRQINEAPDYVPPELDTSIEKDKNKGAAAQKKPAIPAKDAGKPFNDAQILKYFTDATTINPEFTPDKIYDVLYKTKMLCKSDSKMRNCLFDKTDFSFRTLDDPKKTYYNVYQEEYIANMKDLNEFLFMYKKWFELHKFQEVGTPVNDFSPQKIAEFLKDNDFLPKDLEHESVGNILSAYFKSRNVLEEEEKRLNAEKELEKLKKEEEEKKQKLLESQQQEEEAKKDNKDPKKQSAINKKNTKDGGKETENQVVNSQETEEKPVEEEIDDQGVNELNQLFDNFSLDIEKDFNSPPLDENFYNEGEKEKNEPENNLNIGNEVNKENEEEKKIDEEKSNIKENEENPKNIVNEDVKNEQSVQNISKELEVTDNDQFKMNTNMNKHAEELLAHPIDNTQNNLNENNNPISTNSRKNTGQLNENEISQNEPPKEAVNNSTSKVIVEKENEESGEISQVPKDLLQEKATIAQNFEENVLENDEEHHSELNQNIEQSHEEGHEEPGNNEDLNKNIEEPSHEHEHEHEQEHIDNNNATDNNIFKDEQIGQIDENIHNALEENNNDTENIGYERLIINENDEMMKCSLESKKDNYYLYDFEKLLNKSRAMPGIYRPPTLAPMEENLRKAVRAKVYPFLPQDISIPIYEKYNLIHKFEECMKNEIPTRDFDFSTRIYQENLNHDILTQRISKLLLFSPEIKTFYNENTDNMLLMLYYNIPKERVTRKYNKYRYLSKPDFDNWVKYFKPVFEAKKAKDKEKEEEKKEEEQKQQAEGGVNASQIKPEEEKVPPAANNESIHVPETSLHEGNGTNMESIMPGATKKVVNPYIKIFQPLDTVFTDPLYISSDTYIGVVKEKIKYMFPSDNGLFIKKILENGIFSSYSSFVIKDEMVFGIRKDTSKNTEFWHRYDIQGTSLSISKNETGEIYTNLTFVNGLNLQVMPNGEITQKLSGQKNYRVATSKASIIEYITDENENTSMNIYYANGNYSEIKDGKIKNINNKGYQIEKNLTTGEINILDKIPVTVQMDTQSQTSTMIREDGVIQIKYPNKSLLTIHKDATKIFTEVPDENNNFKYMIEHDDYCTINVYITGEEKKYSDKIPNIIQYLSSSSKDGILYEVVCPDRNKVYVFKNNDNNAIILISHIDGSFIKVDPMNNEAIIISPTEVLKYGENDVSLNNDLTSDKTKRRPGLYTVDFNDGKIFTVDSEQNLFEIYDDGYANCVLHEQLDKTIVEEKQEEEVDPNSQSPPKGEANENSVSNPENKPPVENNNNENNPQQTENKNEEVENNNNNNDQVNEKKRPESPDYEKLGEVEVDKKPKKLNANNQNNLNQSNLSDKKEGAVNTSNVKKKDPTTNTNPNEKKEEGAPENEEEKKEEEVIPPPTSNFIIPRLFVIENDSSGYELLNEDQIKIYKKIKESDELHCKYLSQVLTSDYVSHYWVTKYFSIADGIKETHHIHNIQIPETLNKFCHLPKESTFVAKEIYYYRNLIESKCDYNEEFRKKIKEAIDTSNEHFNKKSLEWYFGSYLNKEESKEALEEHNKLLNQILNERQQKDVKFDYEEIKKKIKINKDYIELLENTSSLFDIKKYVEEQENKKIREDLNFRIYPLNLGLTSPNEVEAIVNGINVVPPNQDKLSKTKPLSPVKKVLKKQLPIESHAEREVKFYPNYFESEKGIEYLKDNPHKTYIDPKEKNRQNTNTGDIDRDNITKAQNFLDKAREDYEQQQRMLVNGELNGPHNIHFGNDIDINNKINSPVVYLNENQGPNANSTTGIKYRQVPGRKVLPSIYKQTQILNRINDEYNIQKAREWVESKTMKYTVDGNVRKQNPLVPNYIKPTFPQAEFNEDYIYIDKLTEPRVKTSSVSNRVYFNAPSVEEIRKSGQHDLLIEAIENRRTPEEMMERLNLMITGELCDPLNKQLKIDPVSLDFGLICQGKTYQMYIKLRNDDNMTNRVMVRNGNKTKNYITIENFVGGKVVPGETKKVKVVLRADEEIIGKYNEILEITTKSFIYKIPVKAYIVKADEYDEKRFGHLKGRELYVKSYPASDAKYKCNPIKIVLPKIRELEEKEKKKTDAGQGLNGSTSNMEGDINKSAHNEDEKGDNVDLPPINNN